MKQFLHVFLLAVSGVLSSPISDQQSEVRIEPMLPATIEILSKRIAFGSHNLIQVEYTPNLERAISLSNLGQNPKFGTGDSEEKAWKLVVTIGVEKESAPKVVVTGSPPFPSTDAARRLNRAVVTALNRLIVDKQLVLPGVIAAFQDGEGYGVAYIRLPQVHGGYVVVSVSESFKVTSVRGGH